MSTGPSGFLFPTLSQESEKNLAFVGLLLFKNPLRHDTRGALCSWPEPAS